MKYLTGFTILVLVAAACDGVTSPPANDDQTLAPTEAELARMGPVVHQVIVGGSDSCEFFGDPRGCDANFSLHAIQYADGSAKGEWQDIFKVNQKAPIHAKIDCLSVDGNKAWVSGVITHPEWYAGLEVITLVQDGPDQIGFTLLANGRTCHDQPDLELFPPDNGVVIVR